MSLEAEFLEAFETHSPQGIAAALRAGASATQLIKGKRPIDEFVAGYLRSERFGECLRILIDAGESVGDDAVEAVLLDDETKLRDLIAASPTLVEKRVSVPCAFTECRGATLLHLCAEFNSTRAAQALLASGADVNARAEISEVGLGGQTPIFHAVNSNRNFCRPMLELLLHAGADLDVRVRGLVWGPGAAWETIVVDVTPLAYAQCGLYAQFHRREQDVYSNLSLLYERRFGAAMPIRNVPNRYLAR